MSSSNRPKPLTTAADASSSLRSSTFDYSAYQTLTPRTPHSRAGRAEEGFTEVELDEMREIRQREGGSGIVAGRARNSYGDDDDHDAGNASEPLLQSGSGDAQPGGRGSNNSSGEGTGHRSVIREAIELIGRYAKKHNPWEGLSLELVVSRMPLVVGTLTAGFLLFLIYMSFQSQDELDAWVADDDYEYDDFEGAEIEVATLGLVPVGPGVGVGVGLGQIGVNMSLVLSPENATGMHMLSYENYTHFPLLPTQYRDECVKLHRGYMSHGEYWDVDPHHGVLDVAHHDEAVKGEGVAMPEGEPASVCTKTVTYMLDGRVGLLADLALLAQVAALAREASCFRTFLFLKELMRV